MWRALTRGLRRLRNGAAADREIADEVEHFLEESEAELIRQGLSPAEARRIARMESGGPTSLREERRSYGWENAVEAVGADFRQAVRRLSKNPGFTTVCMLTLALGIGASTAIFSIVEAVLLRSLAYPQPDRIVRVWERAPDGHRMNIAQPNFDDFTAQNRTFAEMAAYMQYPVAVSGGSEPARVPAAEVSSAFFRVFGTAPARGRGFAPEEQRVNGAAAAIVSHAYWKRHLGGSEDLSTFRLRMDAAIYQVVGVMPEGFDYPGKTAIWLPLERNPRLPSRTAHNFRGVGRLRDGVTVADARADLEAIGRRIRDEHGDRVDLAGGAVMPLAEATVGGVQTAMLTLLGAVGLLLLVACANVAGLMLARASAGRKELAVRAALGAGRGRLMQQFVAEAFVLSFGGGALGIPVAMWAVRALPAILPSNLPRQDGVQVNVAVLLFGLGAVVAIAVALGLLAALRATSGNVQGALTSGSRSYSGDRATHRLRGWLVAGEIAVTLVILVGAGLLGRSFVRLVTTDPGFDPRNLITMEFAPPSRPVDDILARLGALQGVVSVGLTGAMPVAAGDDLANGGFLILNGQAPPTTPAEFERIAGNPERVGQALYAVAGENYFRTMGIRLVRGRMFGPRDHAEAPHAAVISEALARQRWPREDPIGQTIAFGNMDGNPKPLTIVGVVGDVRARGLDRPAAPVIYVHYRQRGLRPGSTPTVVLRSARPPAAVAAEARAVFREAAPDVPVRISTFEEELGGWLADRRFLLLLVGFFAAAALTLAAIGIYGVVSFSVARRTQEIGIRMALGSRRSHVLRMVVGEGARLVAAGIVVGLAASFAVTRLLASLLFGVEATDPATFAGVAALLSAVALLASYLPARRATRLDPTIALRYE